MISETYPLYATIAHALWLDSLAGAGTKQSPDTSKMNFGGLMGGGAAAAPTPQPAQANQLMMAKIEMQSYADLFERLSRTCFQKCKFKYTDGQLNVGEMSCIDRCSGKYMQAYSALGVKMAQVEKDIMAQANAGMQ